MAYVGTPKQLANARLTLASIIQGEAAGQGVIGMQAVANVIQNRAKTNFSGYGGDLISQALARNQFQGQATPSKQSLYVADQLLSGRLKDVTGGALYYANPGPSTAAWAKRLGSNNALKIGSHYFTDNTSGTPFALAGQSVEPHAASLIFNSLGPDDSNWGGSANALPLGFGIGDAGEVDPSAAAFGIGDAGELAGGDTLPYGYGIGDAGEVASQWGLQGETSIDTTEPQVTQTQQGAQESFGAAKIANKVKKNSKTIPEAIDKATEGAAKNTAKTNTALEGLGKQVQASSQLVSETAKNITDKVSAGEKNLFTRGTTILIGIILIAGAIWVFMHPDIVRKNLPDGGGGE